MCVTACSHHFHQNFYKSTSATEKNVCLKGNIEEVTLLYIGAILSINHCMAPQNIKFLQQNRLRKEMFFHLSTMIRVPL